MNTVQLDVVTPEQKVYDGQIRIVIAKGLEGELGIQAGHSALVTPLQVGPLRVKEPEQEVVLAVSGGFLEVRPDRVTILAETAELPEDIDVERAKQAKENAESKIGELGTGHADYTVYKQALKRAENRLQVASKVGQQQSE